MSPGEDRPLLRPGGSRRRRAQDGAVAGAAPTAPEARVPEQAADDEGAGTPGPPGPPGEPSGEPPAPAPAPAAASVDGGRAGTADAPPEPAPTDAAPIDAAPIEVVDAEVVGKATGAAPVGPADDAMDEPVVESVDEVELEEELQEELAEEEIERRAARAVVPEPAVASPEAAAAGPARRPGAIRRLYRGETSFPFVERRRWWLTLSAVIIFAGVVSLGLRGLNLGITFKGGTAWTVKAPGVSQSQALDAVEAAGLTQPTVQLIGRGGSQQVRVTADLSALHAAAQHTESTKVIDALANLTHAPATAVSVTTVGPTWGSQVTDRAIIALFVFLALVAVYISIRFEPKMAIAAFVALLHDLLVTAGVYSLAGFQVTPDTVIAVLTILGYSLYDTVVVFDRVRDNTKGLGSSGRMTYSEMVDLSMNQTLARSINTSLVAILPVLAVLLIGAELLGATTLQNYGLALVVGLLSGAYSSIFIASPILAWLKEREPRYVAMRQRIEAKGERLGRLTPSAAAALLTAGAPGGRPAAGKRAKAAQRNGALRPGQARSQGGRAAGNGAAARTAAPAPAPAGTPGAGAATAQAGAADGVRRATGGSAPGAGRTAPRSSTARPRKGTKSGKGGKRRR